MIHHHFQIFFVKDPSALIAEIHPGFMHQNMRTICDVMGLVTGLAMKSDKS
jgi:hypothetical protein